MASLHAKGTYPVIIAQQRIPCASHIIIQRRAWRSDRRILQSTITIYPTHRLYTAWRIFGRMDTSATFESTRTMLSMNGWRILQFTPSPEGDSNVTQGW